jgi:catalase
MGMEDDAKRHEIQQRMLKHRYKVHPDFAAAVEKGISGSQAKSAAEQA